ncbi:MAG: tRNA (adenosine(37)-N6)-threonylcarbamoyltransferase complex transferase subunit TsaD [Patescibacteria group bacterium]
MRILGIESSCDDTSVALVEVNATGFQVIKERTASQIEIHKKYGGVVPEVAGRAHAENILPVIEEVMNGQDRPDAIAVTAGPGLITGLIVGVEAAKALSYLWEVPVISVNHIEGHIHSVQITRLRPDLVGTTDGQGELKTMIEFPALCLIVSGGHTELILMADHGEYEKIGATRDDAAGECFDKIAKLLGLDYPGGPKISKLAETGRTDAILFPRPMIHEKNYDFSFSGLKTAALYWLRDHSLVAIKTNFLNLPAGIYGQLNDEISANDFCASFEQAIADVLVYKTVKAMEEYRPRTVIFAGGVSANKKIQESLRKIISIEFPQINFKFPLPGYCMDNGAMIAVAGWQQLQKNGSVHWQKVVADPNWKIALI